MLTDFNKKIMRNIIYSVETGGQVYGNVDYGNYTGAGTNTPNEKALTIGGGAFYAGNAQKLLVTILQEHSSSFRFADTAGIEQDLTKENWATYDPGKGSEKAKSIQKIITTPSGIKTQDAMVDEMILRYAKNAELNGVTDQKAIMMCCNLEHLGGLKAVKRILKKSATYTLDGIMQALKTDQQDLSSNNQVGDKLYWSRQEKVYKWIKEKAVDVTESNLSKLINLELQEVGYVEKASNNSLDSKTANPGRANYTKYSRDINKWGLAGCQGQPYCSTFQFWAEATVFGLDTALEHFHMTRSNYKAFNVFATRDAFPKSCRSNEPKLGCLVVFKHSHIGRVVDVVGNTIYTVEGNTSPDPYNRDGGKVAKKKYNVNDPKIDCYLIIPYSGADIPAPDRPDIPPAATNSVRYGQRWLNLYYGETIAKNTGKHLAADGVAGSHTRWATLAVWKDLTNRKYNKKLDVKNKNFFESCKAAAPVVKKGADGTYTFIIQFILKAKGYYNGDLDCEFGTGTQTAVYNFQTDHRLLRDGEVGPNTWYKLFN